VNRSSTQPGELRYYPTYSIPVELDADTARWLGAQQGDGPLELSDVTDVCASCGVSAELRDAAGFLVGRVDDKGDYRLGSP
jgi:hypothetical protein